jgi:hypothetical protein
LWLLLRRASLALHFASLVFAGASVLFVSASLVFVDASLVFALTKFSRQGRNPPANVYIMFLFGRQARFA